MLEGLPYVAILLLLLLLLLVLFLILSLHLTLSLMCEPLVNPSIEGGRHTSTDYDTTAARVRAFVDQGGGCRATFFNYRRYLMK